MNIRIRLTLLVLASFVVGVVCAQTTTGGSTSITLPTPPRTITAVAPTPGADSTFQGSVAPNLQPTSSISTPCK